MEGGRTAEVELALFKRVEVRVGVGDEVRREPHVDSVRLVCVESFWCEELFTVERGGEWICGGSAAGNFGMMSRQGIKLRWATSPGSIPRGITNETR